MTTSERISSIAASKKISLKELSRRANIPYTTLYSIVKRNSAPKYSILIQIADALDVKISDLDDRLSTWFNIDSLLLNDDSLPKEIIQFNKESSDGKFMSISMESQEGQLLYNFDRLDKRGKDYLSSIAETFPNIDSDAQKKVSDYTNDLNQSGNYRLSPKAKDA